MDNQKKLPTNKEWRTLSRKAFKKLRYDLEQFAKSSDVNSRELACTVIVVIYSPIGLLMTHLGDGRAGYKNSNNQWLPIMQPHKGEEANQTLFLTSDAWLKDDFNLSGVETPECKVIKDEILAFTLMSDGCESHSFELGFFDDSKQKYIEENKPYVKFFEPLTNTLKGMHNEKLEQKEINIKWSSFIKSGTEKLRTESDDKTLILGVKI